jgi:hypothetical protein
MAHLSLSFPSIETPMERIFEKVMLRKMTQKEKVVLGLSGPSKSSRRHYRSPAIVSRKFGSRLRSKHAVN